MADFEKTHVIIQSTYKNILENFNPGIKQLITTGKALQKGIHNVTSYTKTYLSCLNDLAKGAQSCEGGADNIGECLSQVCDAYNTINNQMIDSIKTFHSELLIPLKAKQDHEFRNVQTHLERYMAGHKFHTARLVKSQFALAKIKKKSKPKQTFNKKEIQCLREVKEYDKALEEYMQKNLRLALLEERKRYCHLFKSLSTVAQNNANHHLQAYELLTKDFKTWVDHCKNSLALPQSSEHFIRQLGFKDEGVAALEDFVANEVPGRRSTFSGGDYPNIPHPPQINSHTINKPPENFNIDVPMKYNTLSHLPRNNNNINNNNYNYNYNNNYNNNNNNNNNNNEIPENFGAPPPLPQSQLPVNQTNDDLRSALFQLKAIHPFKASNGSQLTIETGDVISVYDDVNQGGWIFGLNENTNRIGWFPLAYTQVAELESLKTLSERLANLEDVFVKKSRSLQDSPNFNENRFRKLFIGDKNENEKISTHGSEYETGREEKQEIVGSESTIRRSNRSAAAAAPSNQQLVAMGDETRYETYSSIKQKNQAPPIPFAPPRRSASRNSQFNNYSGNPGTLGKTHRSLGALYSENLLRDLSHGPPPPPPPLPLDPSYK